MVDTNPKALYEPYPAALTALYGDLENFARGQGEVLTGTPGGVIERSNAGGYKYYVHQFYDALGKRTERYVAGPVGAPESDRKAAQLREKISAVGEAIKTIRLLLREGYKFVDSKAYATVATFQNHSLFRSGTQLIGSHAYGVLLNQLGIRTPQYVTQDVDIARLAELGLPDKDMGLLEMLKTTGISFFEVPNLDPRKPSTSFKEAGKSFFQVDLLVPSSNDVGIVPVPDLKAHATSLPYLQYLLGESQDATLLAREGCCAVLVPAPERFAWHKLIVSQVRKRSDKSLRDIAQASVLIAALSERHPGALEEASVALPASAIKHVHSALEIARQSLTAHPRALEVLASTPALQGQQRGRKRKP